MKNITFLVLVLLLLPWPATSGEKDAPTLAKVIQVIENPFSRNAAGKDIIGNFQADFIQTSRIASLDRVQKGKGHVTFRFPRGQEETFPMFRWDYEQPTPQEIVSDGHTLWVYLPENHQVIESELNRSSGRAEDPLLFLAELGNLSKIFDISWADPNRDQAGNYILEMIPKKPSPLLQRLQITVRREALPSPGSTEKTLVFPILSTTAYDSGGNSTLIEFINVRVNRELPLKTFRFKVPEGVEVVHSLEGLSG